MLADFLHAKHLFGRTANEYLKNRVKMFLGSFAGFDERILVEGNSFGHSQSDGSEIGVELATISEGTQMDVDKIKADTTGAYIWQQFDELAAKMAMAQVSNIFKTLKDATTSAGNDIPINKFTPELVLDMWERIEIGFDEKGEPTLPGIFTFNQERVNEYNESVEMIKTTPELRTKMDEIIKVKKLIWDDRESHRKLVD